MQPSNTTAASSWLPKNLISTPPPLSDSAGSMKAPKPSDINKAWGTSSISNYPGPPFLSVATKPLTAEYDFGSCYLPYPSTDDKITSFDYIVVGSGAGGGVSTATLQAAGNSCLVLEKGAYIPPSKLTQIESEAMSNMYEKGGLLTTVDGNIMILAGAGLGGGTRVNWACCLDTPDFVRREWVSELKLPQFEVNSDYDESLKAVKVRLSVNTPPTHAHNSSNKLLIAGCEKLKLPWRVAPQNFKDPTRMQCGWTCFGDKEGNKQSGVETFLRDGAEKGAKFMHCKVLKIVHKANKAIGVMVSPPANDTTSSTVPIFIACNKGVIVSCGSLHTPCLLKRSGFKNSHIGKQ